VDDVLGILELVGWLLLVLAISAAVTFGMVKLLRRLERRRRKAAEDAAAAS
jgi:hypothetical protein